MVSLASDMQNMDMENVGTQMTVPRMRTWGIADFGLTFGMWALMIGIVLPAHQELDVQELKQSVEAVLGGPSRAWHTSIRGRRGFTSA